MFRKRRFDNIILKLQISVSVEILIMNNANVETFGGKFLQTINHILYSFS